jgi:hypothetical protein
MDVEKTPELTGFDVRHTAVKIMPADVASKLRKSSTQDSSLAPSMSSDPHSSTTLLPRMREGGQRWSEKRGKIRGKGKV